MALSKQAVNINFAMGLDTKTDPFQVPVGKFLSLQNSIFTKGGLLQKRNGFGYLTQLPDTTYTDVTTFNGNLTAIGNQLAMFAESTGQWLTSPTRGALRSMELDTLPIVRSNTNQTQCDAVVSANNLVCTVYSDYNGSTTTYKYVVSDYLTNQNIIPNTLIVATSGTADSPPKVFILGNYFIIIFGTSTNHLQYISINYNKLIINPVVDITSQYNQSGNQSFDAYVVNDALYLAWNGTDGGGAIRIIRLSKSLILSSNFVYAGHSGSLISVTADTTPNTPIIYVSFWASNNAYVLAINALLAPVLAPTQFITSEAITNLTSCAQNQVVRVFYERPNNYGYDSAIPTHFTKTNTITQAGVVGTSSILARSVGLASKAFIVNGIEYVLCIYFSDYQPTYFLINSSTQVVAKLAYSNAGGYLTFGLPSALVNGDTVEIAYLFKDLIESVNKVQGVVNSAGIYAQTGVNLVTFTINNDLINTAEIGTNLNISGGFVWAFDGVITNEQNFFLWPDNVEVTTATGSGGLIAQQYFYQALYEWTDAQGNIFRSAPSVPVGIVTTTSSSTNTINVPTLRLTYKVENPVKIVLFRWSPAQENYYQVTSVLAPILNDPTVDYIAITDDLSDADILGNSLIYTTGGVIENISPPATDIMTLFDTRLWLVDSEDKNLLWYSKQIIESTPVEMSDLFTIYVSPTISAQGSTGPITALAPMDDKLVIFKEDAIYYLSGVGPDNTGSNSQFSQPTFIVSTVGCINPDSITLIPDGLMFQSDKGIWLLGRNLQTQYIGAPVEQFNSSIVQSSVNIPGTNQVRFTLDTGQILMYDYYYGQWGTFVGVPTISSTLYKNLHTVINKFGILYQESPGLYLDGSSPVLLSFTTSWLNLAGLQGYERIYELHLLGSYISPHNLIVQIAYEYNPAPLQQSIINPNNYTPNFGGDKLYDQTSPYGGYGSLEQWRVHMQKQLCESFQVTVSEQFNPFFGTAPGGGFTMSGMACIVGLKRGYKPINPTLTVG